MSAKYYVLCDNNCKYEGMTKEQILTAIEQAVSTGTITDVDAGFVTTLKTIDGKALRFFWGTRAEYDKLPAAQKEGLFALITDDTTAQDLFELINNILSGDQVVGAAKKAEDADWAREAEWADKADFAANDAEGNDIPSTYQKKLYQHNIYFYASTSNVRFIFSFLSTTATACTDYDTLTSLLETARTKTNNTGYPSTGNICATGFVINSGNVVYKIEQYKQNGIAFFNVFYFHDTGASATTIGGADEVTDNVIAL